MSNDERVVGGLAFGVEKPTRLSFEQLRTWVVWQFPRRKAGTLFGAVHPPGEARGWYPALIDSAKKRADVYGYVDEPFDSPEAAADWLATV
jgi:hypothetical protein